MKSPLQGFTVLLLILIALGFSVRTVAKTSYEQLVEFRSKGVELKLKDGEITQLHHRLAKENESLTEKQAFYQAWIPEIQKCLDSDSLISALIVHAYALNLVPIKKDIQVGEVAEFRGRTGVIDRIEMTVGGRYDRLVQFLDRVRQHFPFLRISEIEFSVTDASVLMGLEICNCRLTIPEEDLNGLELPEKALLWTQSGQNEVDNE